MTGEWDGWKIHCVVTDKNGNSVTTEEAAIHFGSKLKITSQPKDVTVSKAGDSVEFAVSAEGDGLKYQWQYKAPGSSSWTNFANATGATLKKVTGEWDGWKIHCVVTDKNGNSVTTEEAAIHFGSKLKITSQPKDVTVSKAGDSVEFAVSAEGDGLKYQWQYKAPGSSSWTNFANATGATLKKVTGEWDGWKIHCVVTDKNGNSVTTEEAAIHFGSKLKITSQPKDVTVSKAGDSVEFAVSAEGDGLKYQWQYKAPGSSSWTNFANATGATLKKVTGEWDGWKVHCVVTDKNGNSLTSKEVTIAIVANDTEVTVTLNANGGYFYNESNEKTTTKQETVNKNIPYDLSYKDPSHDGSYVFAGWYNNPDCTGDKVVSYRNFVEKDTTYYAKWIKGVVITFDGNGGHLLGDSTKTSTTRAVTPNKKVDYRLDVPQFTKTSKAFTGWYTDKACTDKIDNMNDYKVGTEDITVYAGWENGIDVTFDANGGSFPYMDNKKVYTATYKKNSVFYTHSSEAQINDKHKVFDGWYKDRECTEAVVIGSYVTEPMTVYAKWTDAVVFTFKGNGGYFYDAPGQYGDRDTAVNSYVKGGTAYLLSAGREGYEFDGWYEDAACTTKFKVNDDDYTCTAEKDIVLYAGWKKANKIVCDANGGYFGNVYDNLSTGTTLTFYRGKDGSLDLSSSYYTPINKNIHLAFDGWYYDKDFKNKVENIANITTDKDITLYAKWADAYAITLDAKGGEFNKDQPYKVYSVKKGGKLVDLDTTPYLSDEDGIPATFKGWYTDELYTDSISLSLYTPTKDVTLYAKWEKQHTITYHGNGGYIGSGPGGAYETSTEYYAEGAQTNITNTATYYGGTMAFSGWYYDKKCTKKADATITMTKNIDLYAGWEEGITITYDLKGGTIPYTDQKNTSVYKITLKKGDYIPLNIYPSKSDKQFDGWYLDENYEEMLYWHSHVAEKNITVYAKWTSTCTLFFDANGGYFYRTDETVAKQEEKESSHVYGRPTPYHENVHNVFTGWYHDQACTDLVDWDSYVVTGDDTFYAGWEEGYVLTLDSNCKTANGSDESKQICAVKKDTAYQHSVNIPTNANSRMVFTGWYTDKDAKPESKVEDLNSFILHQDTTLYAGWEEGIIVTFNANGGYYPRPIGNTTEIETTIKKGTSINVIGGGYIPTYNGDKEFVGWYTDKECKNKLSLENNNYASNLYYYTPKNDIRLYAKWGKKVTVTYDANGGQFYSTGSRLSTDVEKGSSINEYKDLKPDSYSWNSDEEADFAGWYLDAGCTQKVDFDSYIADDNVTFYAKWVRKYKITFDANGGYVEFNQTRTETVSEGESIKSLEKLTASYYGSDKKQFAGWYTDLSFTEKVDFDTYKVTGNVTFYAKWIDVTSDEDDTAFVSSQSATDSSNKAITQKPTEDSTTSDASTIESTEPTATPTPEVTEAPKTAVEEDQNTKSEIPDTVEEENETAEETISEQNVSAQEASVQEDAVTENN